MEIDSNDSISSVFGTALAGFLGVESDQYTTNISDYNLNTSILIDVLKKSTPKCKGLICQWSQMLNFKIINIGLSWLCLCDNEIICNIMYYKHWKKSKNER